MGRWTTGEFSRAARLVGNAKGQESEVMKVAKVKYAAMGCIGVGIVASAAMSTGAAVHDFGIISRPNVGPHG